MRGSKKFRAPKTPLELEAASDTIAPDDQWLDSQVLQMARQLADKGNEADKVAAGMIISQVKQKQFSSTAGKVFLHGFHQFLLGRLPAELAKQSLFGTEPLYDDPEVRAYLEAFIKAKQRFRINLAQMDLRTPKGINQWFLYYKYRILKRDSSEFLSDWSVFETAFNDHPEQKFFDPLHPWMPRPYGISSTTDGRAKLDDVYNDDNADEGPARGIFRGRNNGNGPDAKPPSFDADDFFNRFNRLPPPDLKPVFDAHSRYLEQQQQMHLQQMQAQHAAHLAALQRLVPPAPDQTALVAHAAALDRHSQQLAAVQAPDTAALAAHTAALNAHRDALQKHAQQLAATPPAPQVVMQQTGGSNPPPPPPPAVMQQTGGSNNTPPPPPPGFPAGTFNLPPQQPPLPPQPLPPSPRPPADLPPSNLPRPPPPPPPPVSDLPSTEPNDNQRDPEPNAPPRPTSPPPTVVDPPRPIDPMDVVNDETRKREPEPIAVQDSGKRARPISDEEHEAEKLRLAAEAEAERQKLAAEAENRRRLLENQRIQHEQELERQRREHEADIQRLAAEAAERERQLRESQRVKHEQEVARERQRQQQRMQEHEAERQRLATENENKQREIAAEKLRQQLIANVAEPEQPSTKPSRPRVDLQRRPPPPAKEPDTEVSTKPTRSKKPAAPIEPAEPSPLPFKVAFRERQNGTGRPPEATAPPAAEVMPAAEQQAPNPALRPRRQSKKTQAAAPDEKVAARKIEEGATDTTTPAKKAKETQRTIRPPAPTSPAKKTKAVTTPITTEEVTSLAKREMHAAAEHQAGDVAAQQQAAPRAAINRALRKAALPENDKAAIYAHLTTKVHPSSGAATNATNNAVAKVKAAATTLPHTTEERHTAIVRTISGTTRHKRTQSK